MINIYKDDFDSKILKKNVFKLLINGTLKDNKSILKKIKEVGADIIFAFVKYDNRNIRVFENLGFNLISIRNTYEYQNTVPSKKNNLIKDYRLISYNKNVSISGNTIDDFVKILLPTSRYYKDVNISKKSSKEIYFNWINNSFYKNYADSIFLVEVQNKVAGFISLKLKKSIGYIDLICILPKYRKMGLGSLLIKESLKFFKNKKIKEIYVITEGENLSANAFYQKNSFIIKNVELIYHKHYY